jgi:hypothetical protein
MDALEGIQVLRSRHSNSLRVGFTGSRAGMTTLQWAEFEGLFKFLCVDRNIWWHDGVCLGADEQAHKVVQKVATHGLQTIGHPCNLKKWQADLDYDQLRDERPPLVRNKKIVEQVDLMFAAPQEFDEVKIGSGTWATIRYTRRKKKPLIIVWPDGTTELENM